MVILVNLHILIIRNQRLLILQINLIVLEKLLNIWQITVNTSRQALTVKQCQLMVWRNLINLRSVLIKLLVAVKWAQLTSRIISNLRNLIVNHIRIITRLFICLDFVFVQIFSTFPRLNRFLGFI